MMHTHKRTYCILAALTLATMLLPLTLASAAAKPASIQNGQGKQTATFALPGTTQSTEASKARTLEAHGQLPLSFIPNQGQVDKRVGYYVQSGGQSLWFAADGVTMALPETTLHLEFLGANPSTRLEGGDKLPGIVNYFIGNDPAKWRTNIPTYGRITYHDLWPGVDLTYEGRPGALKSTFTIAPGADPTQIQLSYSNVDSLVVDQGGNLIINIAGQEVRESAPLAWQEIGGQRVPVAVTYQVTGRSYGFALPEGYDPSYPLVIDPKLVYSTFLGGTKNEGGNAITVDSSGAVYVAGTTYSSDFPTVNAYDSTFDGYNHAFVAKVSAAGDALVYSTFLGGSNWETGRDIAVDGSGNAYVTGATASSDFPTVNAYDSTFNGGDRDVYVAKLSPAGNTLVYSTFLGGNDWDDGWGITVDNGGAVYVTGRVDSSDFPTVNAYDSTFNGGNCDVFVTKLSPAGNTLVYSTFLGGSSSEVGQAIAVDGSGAAYVMGDVTTSSDFPTHNAYDSTHNGGYFDAFATKLSAAGNTLIYSTFLGGSDYDNGRGIAVDGSGAAYMTGWTQSSDFPIADAYDSTHNGNDDVYVTKLSPAGNALVYSTFLGGSGRDWVHSIAVDANGAAYVIGSTESSDFPTFYPYDDTLDGASDAFVTKLSAAGNVLLYSTFLGGSDSDSGGDIAVDGSGSAYVTGSTYSSNFPTTAGALDTSHNGYNDAFVLCLDFTPTWTLMFYMDGDNNLDSNYVAAFNQLESTANNPNVNVLVAWDRSANGNSAYYKVQHDTDLNETDPAADYTDNVNRWPKSELSMSHSTTLSDFIQWARTNYPAQHYALVISDHGTGLNGLATDNGSGGDWLRVTEWSSALATATSDGTDKIDVIFADACLMAMIEDAYQIRNYTDYYVASENIGWVTGVPHSGPYDEYISSIEATTSPRDLAIIFANRYAGWLNADHSALPYTISAVDLGQLAPLVSAVNTLASNLNAQMGTYGSQVTNARTATQKFDSNVNFTLDQNDAYMDLYDFAQNVKSNVPDATIQNTAQSVMDAVMDYVIAETHHTGSYNDTTWNLDNSHGASIFFPPNASSFYNSTNYEFAVGATWLGSQGAFIRPQASDVEWGPMLVTYFNETQPGGPDTPEPPPLASPLAPEGSSVYLPIILKGY